MMFENDIKYFKNAEFEDKDKEDKDKELYL